MIEVDMVLFIVMCIFGGIGALLAFFIFLYIVVGFIDYTQARYKEQKQEEENKCPEKIDHEDF